MKSSKFMKSLFSLFVFFGMLFAFVGCYDTVNYKVTFEVEGKVVASVIVEKGKTVPQEQLPANPEKEGYEFVGWFNGETEFKPSSEITDNVRYTAKFEEKAKVFYQITFVNEGEVSKTLEVEEGQKVDFKEVPADPTKKAHEFMGWYNGEVLFDEDAPILEDATYVAKFERTHFVVTFGSVEMLVSVGETLTLVGVESPSQENAYFAGWVCDGVMATEGMSVTDDMAFEPHFVMQQTFNGVWSAEDGTWFDILDGVVANGIFGSTGQAFIFNVENGKLEYDATQLYMDKYSFEVTATGIKFVHTYYDGVYEEMVNEEVALSMRPATGMEGKYRVDKSSYIEIINGGVVSYFDGAITKKGIVSSSEEGMTITYLGSASSEKTISISVDEKGNIVAQGKIYVRNCEEFSYLYLSGSPMVYFYTVSDEKIVVVKESSNSYYATCEGSVEVDQIITIRYNEQELVMKVTGQTSYELAGSEKGTYTAGDKTLELDGFGTATIDGVKYNYTVNALGVCLFNGEGYKLNLETHTYEKLVKDAVNTGKYIYNENSKYTMFFDGFGGVALYYSTYTYNGSYTLSEGKIVITKCNYYADGTWTIEEDGKVLTKDNHIYLLEGATFTDVREEMNGVYGAEGTIIVSTGKIVIDGKEYTLTYNYNGSKASYSFKHKDPSPAGVEVEFTDVVTISKTVEGKLLVSTAHETWDEYGEYPEITVSTTEYEVYTQASFDAFKGTWVGTTQAGVKMTYVFNGDGTGSIDGTSFTYTVSGNTLTFNYAYSYDYTFSGDPSTGTLTVEWEYDYEAYPSFEVTKQAEEAEGDAFKGTWVGTTQAGVKMTYVFNGDGTGSIDGTSFTYTVSGNTLTFNYAYSYDYTFSGDPSTGTLTVEWEYDYEAYPSFEVTKQA